MADDSQWEDVKPNNPTDNGQWEDVQSPQQKQPYTTGQFNQQGSLVQDVKSALPLYGSIDAAKEGYKQGQQLLGDNIAGKVAGVGLGAVESLGTIGNPIAKGLGYIPRVFQANAERLGGQPGQAMQTLTGSRDVLPDVKPGMANTGSQALDTALNMGSDLATQARKDPLNAAMVLESGSAMKGALNAAEAAKTSTLANRGVHSTSSNLGDSIVLEKPGTPIIKDPQKIIDDEASAKVTNALDLPKGTSAIDRDHINRALVEAYRANPDDFGSFQGIKDSNQMVRDKIDNVILQAKNLPTQDTSDIGSAIQEAAGKMANTPERQALVDSLVNKYEKINPQMTPEQLINEEKLANGDSKTFAKDTFENRIKVAERQALSDKVDNLIAATGYDNASDIGKIKRGTYLLDDQLEKVRNKIDKDVGKKHPGLGADIYSAASGMALGMHEPVSASILGGLAIKRALNKASTTAAKNPLSNLNKLHKTLQSKLIIENTPAQPPPIPQIPQGMSRDQTIDFLRQYQKSVQAPTRAQTSYSPITQTGD